LGIKITDKLVRELAPPAAGNRVTYDSEVSGFGIRITKAGARSFVLNYRAEGRERRLTLGQYPAWSVEQARAEAKKRRREVDGGADPLAHRTALRQAPTLSDLCDAYIEEHLPNKRELSALDDRAMIAKHIRPKFGAEKLKAIDSKVVARLHRSLKATPYRANRVLSLLSKMFSLAVEWGWLDRNPAKGIQRNQEEKRERFLDPGEIASLTKVLAKYADQSIANIIRMLLLTGARRGEVLRAEWSQFNLDTGTWVKPAATTKQNKLHRVPLSDGAVALLKSIHEAAPRDDFGTLKSKHVFPGPRSGEPMSEIKDEWRAIALAAGLYEVVPGAKPEKQVNCRLHDLRHTYASILASAGLSLPIIGQLLGHTQAATTARYSHLMDDPLRAATNRVAATLAGKKSADVVPIGERRA
jgi:integrase